MKKGKIVYRKISHKDQWTHEVLEEAIKLFTYSNQIS